MSTTNDMWQQIKYGDKTYEVQVYSGVKDTQGTPFVLLEDIQYYFPDVSKFMIGRRLVSFMRDQNCKWLMPLRFAYQPGIIVETATTESFTSQARPGPKSSPPVRETRGFVGTSPRHLT
ncbi:hypothetical protein BGZ58_004212 [Dissophora ornata]|nr:hypothetical protein BGZ58_004212 [Dissophora ornata]